MLIVGIATPGPDMHGNCIAILARATTISLALIVNFIVVFTSIRIYANAIID
jgi:hypothetical protein